MDMVGKVLGNRYEILEKIGTGGMATVYKAKCRVLNRYVAVKILKDEFANDSEFIKRFQVEAQSAASLSHPNIVSIFDVGNDNGMHYIVMELIEGKTLKEIITEKGKLPWRDAVKIAAQIASGLSHAHKNHIIHRDIKPHNIIITKDGVAKVTDFGIAKAVSNSTINAFGSTIGSVHYFSPEHARGGYTDEKSDIYSLGVVLYEMCTGRLPFDAETPVSVAIKHLQEKPVEPIEINKDIPDGLNAIIMKAMQKEASNRYASADKMYDDLMKLLKNPEDVTLKNMNNGAQISDFPTQRVPIVGINNTSVNTNEEKNVNKNIYKEEEEDLGKSKKQVTKQQAIIKLCVFLVCIVAVFFICVKAGSAISTMILGGNDSVEVPAIVGCSREEAEKMLTNLGLKIEIQANVESSEYPSGYVTYQEYAQGYQLKKGAIVGVRLSRGEKKVLVPDVSLVTTTTAAKMKIEKAGLVYKEEYEFHDTIPSGDIIRQEPKVNTEVEKDSTVVVYVSKGPASGDSGLVKVPSVVNMTEEEARKTLDDAKLIAKVTYISTKGKEDGKVVSQTPEENSYQAELSEIVIVVNKSSEETAGSSTENEENNNGTTTKPVTKKRKVTLDLSNMGERSKFNVKVVLEGTSIGKKIEYEAEHSRDDGKIQVEVSDVEGAMLKVYIDDVLKSEMPL